MSGKAIIVASAIRYDGVVASIAKPARHHHIIYAMNMATGRKTGGDDEQGFLTSDGQFVDRNEACIIAREAGQIETKHGPDDMLFSEDLW